MIFRDDVCVLSVTGTAAIINLMFTSGEIGVLNTTLSKGTLDTDREIDAILKKNSPPKSQSSSGKMASSKISKIVEVENGSSELSAKKSIIENDADCSICHIPYSRSSVPFNEHMKKCLICK